MRRQTGKIIADGDMDRAMSYCYGRGNGQYTRLVPVDMLPMDLRKIPRRVNTDEGMIGLPVRTHAWLLSTCYPWSQETSLVV